MDLIKNFWSSKPQYKEVEYPDQQGKTFVVTGGLSGVGMECVRLLLKRQARVVIVGRNKEFAKEMLSDLAHDIPDGEAAFVKLDLADLESVKKGGQELAKHHPFIHGVVLNAGTMAPPYSKTKQGHEIHWGTNVMGHHLLMKYLEPCVLRAARDLPEGTVRIVWVATSSSSLIQGSFRSNNNKDGEKKPPHLLYNMSKTGNAYEAYLWSKFHPDTGVYSVSVDPGNLATNITRNSGGLVHRLKDYVLYPAKFGAYTELAALLGPTIKDGDHLVPWGVPGNLRQDVDEDRRGPKGEEVWMELENDTQAYFQPVQVA
ncbi:putative oxidoreductase [Yarrowia sp. C11]|nr:putative oxidoreductase [Yarrowia sp. E02]KAG5369168.1 putative oxidoreductase [Yarrowia sp. C11]